jgi:PAS domain S-box-containing protein
MNEEVSRARVLIVDDEPLNIELLSFGLNSRHYDIYTANNGRIALNVARQHLPDLILLDIRMPEMDGFETCEQLKADEQLRLIPVIFLSAEDNVWHKVRALQSGGVDYITKPFIIEEVIARIEAQLRISRQQQEIERLRTQDQIHITQLQDEIERRSVAEAAERHQRILNAQLYEQISLHAAQLEELVAQRTAELRQSKEQAEAILDNASDAIILTDPSGRVQQANAAFGRMFGVSPALAVGQPLSAFFEAAAAELLAQTLTATAQSQQTKQIELTAQRQNGSPFEAELALCPLNKNNHIPVGLVGSLRDISQQKQFENQQREVLQREQDLSGLKTRLIQAISHEFRTPLTIIQSSAEMLVRYHQQMDEKQIREKAARIETGISRLVTMLDNVLEVSEIAVDSAAALTIDLVQLCQDAVHEIGPAAPAHQIIFSPPPAPLYASLSGSLLRKAVEQLLKNAIKFSPHGGAIQLGITTNADTVLISITDQGIGIPADEQPLIFSPFHRASNVGALSGSGIGLALVQKAIEALNGTLSLESIENVGSTFTICLPYSADNTAAS